MATTNSTSVGSPNTAAEISVLVKTDYESYMWDRAVANFVHARFGKPATIARGKGGKKEWRRLSAMTAQTTPLDEDNTPDAIALTWEDKQAEPLEYGAWVRYTHFLEFRSIDPLIMETAQLLGENCGDTIDKITRDELASGFTVVQYQNGLANLAAVTSGLYFTYETLTRAYATARAANARPLEGFGKPILILHPHVVADLANDTTVMKGWDNRGRLGQGNPYEEGFIGELWGCLVYESSNATITTQVAAPDIYDSLLIFNNAYGVVGLAENTAMMPEPDQMGNNTGGTFSSPVELVIREKGWNDFFGRFGGLGWYATHDTLVLDPTFAVRIRTASRLGSAT